MNAALLRRLWRTLESAGFTRQEAHASLRQALFVRLAGNRAAWLAPFANSSARPLPPEAARLLDNVDLNPTPDDICQDTLGAMSEFFSLHRKPTGIFYTPFPVARRLARATLFYFLTRQISLPETAARDLLNGSSALAAQDAARADDALSRLTVCDPAAGAGGLLIPFAQELVRLRLRLNPALSPGETWLHTFTHTLYAGDISAQALADLQLRAALLLLQAGIRPPNEHPVHTLAGDALAAANGQSVWHNAFPTVWQAGGFDLVLANPPYVGQKHHREVFEALRRNPLWQPYCTPKSDLLYFFFYLSLYLLRQGGMGAFLTPPYFASAAGAKTLRACLYKQTALLYLQDFEDKHLFGAAAGEHSLITVFEKNSSATKPACRVGERLYPQETLYRGEEHFLQTRPVPAALESALTKMAAAPHTLGQVAHVSNGLMTGCDKISAAHLRRFDLPGVHKGDGVFVLSAAEKAALHLSPAEQAKLKPFFKNSDISAYTASARPHGFLIDFFYPNDRDLDFALYPHLRAHLARFRPVLLARKQNNNGIHKLLAKGIYWFGSVRRKMNFEEDKIAVPQRATANTFAFAPGPWYASSDVYFISRPQKGLSLWFLLALLNSAPYFAWLAGRGKRKGRLLELYSAPLKALPIPRASQTDQNRLAALARQIYQLKSADPQADISALQAQIDRQTGALFGFTPAETTAVCAARKQAR